uniref:GAF domain-containing protein n=1 Tax=Dunaliella tertiolecta TaxID=3047 RepID=A0A7S3QZQ4_DUNTE
MGNCLSAKGGSAQQDASSKQESQVRQGRQHRARKEEAPGYKQKAEARNLEAREENSALSHQTLETTPSKHSLAHDDSAKDLSGRCEDNAKDSASDWALLASKQCLACTQGGVHDSLALGPPVCANEAGRIETFTALGLDKVVKPCPELDFVLQAVCRAFSAPYASLSLYYNKTCWLANTVGFPNGGIAWNLSGCPWALMVQTPQTIACGDLREDARFADQPWTHSGLRTYCSAPLLASNGERLGSCCFLDYLPRKVDAGMCRLLNNFGEIAVRVLERHIGLAVRLAEARQVSRLLSNETAYFSRSSEGMKALDSCHVEDEQQQQQQQQEQHGQQEQGVPLSPQQQHQHQHQQLNFKAYISSPSEFQLIGWHGNVEGHTQGGDKSDTLQLLARSQGRFLDIDILHLGARDERGGQSVLACVSLPPDIVACECCQLRLELMRDAALLCNYNTMLVRNDLHPEVQDLKGWAKPPRTPAQISVFVEDLAEYLSFQSIMRNARDCAPAPKSGMDEKQGCSAARKLDSNALLPVLLAEACRPEMLQMMAEVGMDLLQQAAAKCP